MRGFPNMRATSRGLFCSDLCAPTLASSRIELLCQAGGGSTAWKAWKAWSDGLLGVVQRIHQGLTCVDLNLAAHA